MTTEITMNILDILTNRKTVKEVQLSALRPRNITELRDLIIEFYSEHRLKDSVEFLQKYIQGAGRVREYVRIRQMICYFAYKTTPNSLKSIGNVLGGRDHSTVIHSIQKIEDGLSLHKGKPIDMKIANDVKDITIFLILKN